MTLTPEILDELERLEKAATTGPWCIHPNGTSLWQGEKWTGNQLGTIQRHICNATGTQEQHAIDLELLCEVRNHLPALIAAARENERLKLPRTVSGIEAENARLKRELRETTRALRLAQAKALGTLADALTRSGSVAHRHFYRKGLTRFYATGPHCNMTARQRAIALVDWWSENFERMAADCGEEMG